MLRTHTTAYLISRAKTAQDARQFFVWRFGGSANDRSVQLEPQICLLTNSTGRSPFFVWRFGGSANDRSVLEPQMCLINSTGRPQFFCLALQRFCQRPQCAMRAPSVLENSTGPWPICFLALRRLSATACARLGPGILGKQHRILFKLFLALQRLCQRPQCAFRLRSAWKTAQDARQFVFRVFWPLLVSKCTLGPISGPKGAF